MSSCCGRRPYDGRIERDNIEGAMHGRAVELNPPEFEIVVFRMARERRWGLQQIAARTGYSRSQVAVMLAKQRKHIEARKTGRS